MKAAIGVLLACMALAGCTEAQWAGTLDYAGVGDEPDQAEAAAPVTPVVPAQAQTLPAADQSGFCENVARQAAGDGGFDPATQQRVYQSRLAQCQVMIYGAAPAASPRTLNARRETGTL